jgi:hypothetical protein
MTKPHTTEELCMDMGKATTDCRPCPVDENIWTQCSRHGPGEKAKPVGVTNRSIIYRLIPEDGDPFLVVLNGLWVDQDADQPFKGLRALEEETGAPIRYILAPGTGHHLSLPHYAKAFPDARVCVAEGRIPRENPELVTLDNVDVFAVDSPPEALASAGLRLYVLRGLMEGPGTAKIQKMVAGRKGYVCNAVEELMILHVPSGAITSGGHQWWFVPEGHKGVFEVPFLMKIMMGMMGLGFGYMRPGAIACETNHAFAVHDRDALQASCKEVLSWEFDKLLDLHAQINTCPTTGAKAMFEDAIGPIAAGRWDDVPWKEGTLPAS